MLFENWNELKLFNLEEVLRLYEEGLLLEVGILLYEKFWFWKVEKLNWKKATVCG